MTSHRVARVTHVEDSDWVPLPGGELEAPRPKVLCTSCRARLAQAAAGTRRAAAGPRVTPPGALCFNCYRAGLDRERAIKAAAELDTASEARFQGILPLEPINRSRLARLRVERTRLRAVGRTGAGQAVDRRRQAQIAARHALERIVVGLRARHSARESEQRALAEVGHAAELQVPEAWLPFVLAR